MFCVYFIVHAFGYKRRGFAVINIDNISYWVVKNMILRFRPCLNILLRYHKGDEAETRHTCLGHQPLHKLCFLFWPDTNSGCYDNLYFP